MLYGPTSREEENEDENDNETRDSLAKIRVCERHGVRIMEEERTVEGQREKQRLDDYSEGRGG